jgi:CSLREA domain-containing protein
MPSTLLRRLTITLAIVFAGAAALAATPAHAANTYYVNSTADTPDATVTDASCRTADRVCTLRAAIQQANATNNDPDGPDQIMVGVGRITLDAELPAITSDMDIRGDGPGAVLWGNAEARQRVLSISQGAHVRIFGLTISHGAAAAGGGILNSHGDLTLTDCKVAGNIAAAGGGVWSAGNLTIVRSTIRDNNAMGSGWAPDWPGDTGGGGLYTWGGITEIDDSTIDANGAIRGGGLDNRGGHVSVTGTTFSGNNSFTDGGGISNPEGEIILLNSTLVANTALRNGGGIENYDSLRVLNSTITGNSAARAGGIYFAEDIELRSALVAGNTASSGPDLGGSVFHAVISQGGNLIGNGRGVGVLGTSEPADQIGTAADPIDPMLEPKPRSDDGPTETVALLPGSPAIDRGVDAPAPYTDQRGVARRRGAHVDVGAYESPNRAPVHTLPEDIQSTGEDTPLVFSAATGNAIGVADPDSAAITTTLSVPEGRGTLTGGTDTVTLSGSPAEITEALDGLRFTPARDTNGPLQLTIETTDHGDGTPDSAETDSDAVAITVRAANDPPVASDDALAANPQVIAFAQLLGNDTAGPANEAGQTLTVTAVKDGAGGTAKLSDGGIVFTPAPGFRGRAEFTYEVQDNGSTNDADDPRTATAQVRFDVTAGPAPQPTIAPVVTRVSLASGKVVVTFSQAIDPHALTIRITTRNGRRVSATMRYDKVRHRIVLTPRHPLAAGRYVVTVRGALTGKWSFTVRR